jgi:lipocalin
MPRNLAMLGTLALVMLGLGLTGCSSTRSSVNAPVTARAVDLSRYAGRWFEIARLPMRLWLLARTPTIPEPRYEALVATANQLGFDPSRLLKTPQR